jgi:hypothetical protein
MIPVALGLQLLLDLESTGADYLLTVVDNCFPQFEDWNSGAAGTVG